jgi:pimeloyl-[acyl-carrier protein] methyl ester esterase
MKHTDLFIKQQGQGEPLICIHGWGFNGEIWNAVATQLATQWQVLQVDLPGHGRSPMSDYQLPILVEQLAYALPSHAVWLGWSLGGLLSMATALQYPNRVRALVLVSTSPRFITATDWTHAITPEVLKAFAQELQQDVMGTLQRFLALQVRGSEAARQQLRTLHKLLKGAGLPQSEALQGGLDLLLTTDLRTQLHHIQCPTLLYLGSKDTLIPVGIGEDCQKYFPHLQTAYLPTAGHLPFLSHPQDFLQTVQTFLHECLVTGIPR